MFWAFFVCIVQAKLGQASAEKTRWTYWWNMPRSGFEPATQWSGATESTVQWGELNDEIPRSEVQLTTTGLLRLELSITEARRSDCTYWGQIVLTEVRLYLLRPGSQIVLTEVRLYLLRPGGQIVLTEVRLYLLRSDCTYWGQEVRLYLLKPRG